MNRPVPAVSRKAATRYHQPPGSAELAALLHCNADYLGRVFRATFSLTLTDALHQQRVCAAETLLLTENGTLAEVAMLTGFNDTACFLRVLPHLRGITPAGYKKGTAGSTSNRTQRLI